MQNKLTQYLIVDKAKSILNINPNEATTKLDYFVIDTDNLNTNVTVQLDVKPSQTVNLFFYCIANHQNKNLSIQINSASQSTSNINIKNFANNGGKIAINLVANAAKGSTNINTNQTIDGLIFDNESNIKVIPSLIVDTNAIKATHAVNIGNINPEQLFYLMSRRMSKTAATNLIIQSMTNDLHKLDKLSKNNIYNYVAKALVDLLKTYEKY
jgi:Fe-S cluster assembly protein SufD